jgi:hypothetical protein
VKVKQVPFGERKHVPKASAMRLVTAVLSVVLWQIGTTATTLQGKIPMLAPLSVVPMAQF